MLILFLSLSVLHVSNFLCSVLCKFDVYFEISTLILILLYRVIKKTGPKTKFINSIFYKQILENKVAL